MQNIYSTILTKHLNILLTILMSVFIVFAINVKNFELDASSDTLILDDDKDLKKYREIINDYSTKDFLIITISNKEKLISKDNIKFINLFTNRLANLKWVDSVQSILDVPLLSVNNQNLSDLVNEILTIESPKINLLDAEKEILDSPIFKNLILSEDATTTGIIVYFKTNQKYEELINKRDNFKNNLSYEERELQSITEKKYQLEKKIYDAERHENILEIRNIIKEYKESGLEIHLGGVSMIADDTITFVKNDILIFGFGALLFILLVLYLVFRNFTWMLVSVSNCAYALIVMIGVVSILNWKATVISSNFIMLMLILSLSMTVHIVVRYRQFINDYPNLEKIEILIKCLQKMYRPCLFSALTTIFAFATLYTSGIKPVMDFGLMMCVGLIITYLSSFIFLPAAIMKVNLKKIDYSVKHANNSLFLSTINNVPKLTLFIFTLLLCMGIYGSTTLKVENSFIDYFKKDTEIYKGMKLIDEKLGGTTPLDIIVQFEESKDSEENTDDLLDFGIEYNPADYWFTEEKMNTIKQIHDHLETYEYSGKVLSLASLIRAAEKLNSDKEFDTLELAILYKKLPIELKDQILSPYVSIDKNQARITMRIIDTHTNLRRNEFIKKLSSHLDNNYLNADISISGILILYNNMLQSLFDSQIKSLAIVMVGIFLMLLILFRSLKIATITIIPNIIACFSILGVMGIIGIPLDLMTITIAAITIGIAVDNCIHYVYRYREYFSDTKDHLKTIEMCQNSVGRAIQNTSITIIAGFSILVFSNFYPTIYFGIFTALAMFIALLGSLTLLPILLKNKS